MLKLADGLTEEKVDEILSRLLPSEKSARRRMNKLESFVFTRAQNSRAWVENYLMANHNSPSDDTMEDFEKRAFVISIATLFEFEAHLVDEAYWRNNKVKKSAETVEARIMDFQPCRWIARFPQNRGRKTSRNVSGTIYDSVIENLAKKKGSVIAKDLFSDLTMIIDWHPELENHDRVSECRWNDEAEDWDLVVVKPDGRIIGHPTKTLEDIAKEGILAKSKTEGVSGRKIILQDAFLGILNWSA